MKPTRLHDIIDFDNDAPAIFVISKRNSGKSFLLNQLITEYSGKWDYIVIMSRTVAWNDDYVAVKKAETLFKKEHKYVGPFNLTILKQLEAACQAEVQKSGKKPKVLVLLDDIVGELKTGSVEHLYVGDFFTVSRHFGITLIMSIQRATATFSPVMRQNVDYLLFSKVNDTNLRALTDVVADMSLRELKALRNKLEPFQFVLYDNKREKGTFLIKVDKSKVKEPKIAKPTTTQDEAKANQAPPAPRPPPRPSPQSRPARPKPAVRAARRGKRAVVDEFGMWKGHEKWPKFDPKKPRPDWMTAMI